MNLFKKKYKSPDWHEKIQQRAMWKAQIEILEQQIHDLKIKIRESYEDGSIDSMQSPRVRNNK